ncbi:unnamed protein product [Phytophthora lilii]|uniref:Unnamed protein product n=1 Tax=Phytophthora lilii TaxID=2077276 RepID=A0A9W6XFA1_9STRA|nr:unnamed protein product [Phytophthora lilii]
MANRDFVKLVLKAHKKSALPQLPLEQLGLTNFIVADDTWTKELYWDNHVLPICKDLKFRVQHNALGFLYKFHWRTNVASPDQCIHDCSAIENAVHLFGSAESPSFSGTSFYDHSTCCLHSPLIGKCYFSLILRRYFLRQFDSMGNQRCLLLLTSFDAVCYAHSDSTGTSGFTTQMFRRHRRSSNIMPRLTFDYISAYLRPRLLPRTTKNGFRWRNTSKIIMFGYDNYFSGYDYNYTFDFGFDHAYGYDSGYDYDYDYDYDYNYTTTTTMPMTTPLELGCANGGLANLELEWSDA